MGDFPVTAGGLVASPRTLPVQKEREDLFKTLLAREQRVIMGALRQGGGGLTVMTGCYRPYSLQTAYDCFNE